MAACGVNNQRETDTSVALGSLIASAPAPREEKFPVVPAHGATAGAFPTPHAAATAASIVSQMASCRPHLNALSELFGEKVFKELGKLTVEQVCTLALIHCMTRIVKKGGTVHESHRKILMPFLQRIEEKKWGNMGALFFAFAYQVKTDAVKAEYDALKPALAALDALLVLDMRRSFLKECAETTDSQEVCIAFCVQVHREWMFMIHPLLLYLEDQFKTSEAFWQREEEKITIKKARRDCDVDFLQMLGTIMRHCASNFVCDALSQVLAHNERAQALYKLEFQSPLRKNQLLKSLEMAIALQEKKLVPAVNVLTAYLLDRQLIYGVAVKDEKAQLKLTAYFLSHQDVNTPYLKNIVLKIQELDVTTCDETVDRSKARYLLFFLFDCKINNNIQVEITNYIATINRPLFELLSRTKAALNAKKEKLKSDLNNVHRTYFQSMKHILPPELVQQKYYEQHHEYFATLEGLKQILDIHFLKTIDESESISHLLSKFCAFFSHQLAEASTMEHSALVAEKLRYIKDKCIQAFRTYDFDEYNENPEKTKQVLEEFCTKIAEAKRRTEELQTCHTPLSDFFHGLFKTLFAMPSLSEEELLNDPMFFIEKRRRPQKAEKVTIAIKSSEGAAAASEEPAEEPAKAAAVATAAVAVRVEKPLLLSSLLFGPREARDLSYHLNHVQWSLELLRSTSTKPSDFRVFVPTLIHHLYLALEVYLTSQLQEEEEYELFHGIVALMRDLGLTRYRNRAWQINYATFWFRFPNQSLNNYAQRPPRLLQLISDVKREDIDCKAIQIELEKAVTSLLPIISQNLHIGMVKPAAIPDAPLARDLQKIAADLNGCEETFKKLFASKKVIVALPVLQDAFEHFMQLKELINMLFRSQRYLSVFVDSALTLKYLTVKLMGATLAAQRGFTLHGIHNIEEHWETLQLQGKIEGVKKEHFKELNLQKAGDYPTTVPEFMSAYEFACAATTGVEGAVPAGYSEKLDLYQKFNESLERRMKTVLAYVTYVLNQLSEG